MANFCGNHMPTITIIMAQSNDLRSDLIARSKVEGAKPNDVHLYLQPGGDT